MKHDFCRDHLYGGEEQYNPNRFCLCPESTCAVLEMQATYIEIQAARMRFAQECKTIRETLAFGVPQQSIVIEPITQIVTHEEVDKEFARRGWA